MSGVFLDMRGTHRVGGWARPKRAAVLCSGRDEPLLDGMHRAPIRWWQLYVSAETRNAALGTCHPRRRASAM